ncbi:peptidoglycan editing factor PgeF [Cetobacterium sp.]|uniref:peptidoglycan editing factor PgeF n=1 Tax=Cetobacterium sp. TaxID=2071632 RepID=UPI003F2A2526
MFIDKKNYWELEEFKEFNLKAIYTTKPFGDVRNEEDRKNIISTLKIEDKKIYSGYQTHSDNIVVIEKETPEYSEDTDGFLTDRDDVVIFTKYADCLPIYFYDKKTSAYGCVHSGWVGSYKKIGVKAVQILQERFKADLENIIVAFGIGISSENYEVSEEFYEKFKLQFSEKILENVFYKIDKRYFFDNQKFNYNLMIDYGIKRENIIENQLCTFEGDFHSHRREKELSGRNGAYIFVDISRK